MIIMHYIIAYILLYFYVDDNSFIHIAFTLADFEDVFFRFKSLYVHMMTYELTPCNFKNKKRVFFACPGKNPKIKKIPHYGGYPISLFSPESKFEVPIGCFEEVESLCRFTHTWPQRPGPGTRAWAGAFGPRPWTSGPRPLGPLWPCTH